MQLQIDQTKIEAAIQEHLNKVVQEGINYKVRDSLNDAIAASITPEVVAGFVNAAMLALTSPDITQRIAVEMNRAFAEGVRLVFEEALVAVACRLRGYRTGAEDRAQFDAVRQRLFPKGDAS